MESIIVHNPEDIITYLSFHKNITIKTAPEIFKDKVKIISFLKRLKKIISIYSIDYNKIDFYDNRDFINFLYEKYIYLPYNINLFISTTCDIGCKFCMNKNDLKLYLDLKYIFSYLDNYKIADNINFNIIGEGDPLNYPYLNELIYYLKKRKAHITLFSGWDNLLRLNLKQFNIILNMVDFFKINLSSYDVLSYNEVHNKQIDKINFNKLVSRLKMCAPKLELIYVVVDLDLDKILRFLDFAKELGVYSVSIKRDDWFINNIDIKLLTNFLKSKHNNYSFNILTNFWFNIWKKKYLFYDTQKTLLNNLFNNMKIDLSFTDGCYQFWQSLDITERKQLSVCCVHDVGVFSKFFSKFNRQSDYFKQLNCEKCPLQVDRYKNYIKYKFVKAL